MIKTFLVLLISVSVSLSFAFAQNGNSIAPSPISEAPLKATIRLDQTKEDWMPMLKNVRSIHQPGINKEKDTLLKIKEEANKAKREAKLDSPSDDAKTASTDPMVTHNWTANQFNNSIPNDNHIAVSNGYKVISVTNSLIRAYNDGTSQINPTILSMSLQTFSANVAGTDVKYDPRVIYDPIEDKFIVVFLSGNTAATTKIVIGFSTSNDPAGTWNLYAVTGDPNNDNLWTDYPQINISEDELFITGNLFTNAGSSQYPVIWQMEKADGYAGNSVTYVTYTVNGAFALYPIPGGSAPYGPNMWFLNNISTPTTSSTSFYTRQVTNTIASGNNVLTSQVARSSNTAYRVSPDADQPVTNKMLNTNECRVQTGYFENGIVQFAFNTRDASLKPAVYHGIIDNIAVNPSISGQIISGNGLEIAYPSMIYSGVSTTDFSSLLFALHSSSTVYPGGSVLYIDSNFVPSNWVTVKDGNSYMNTGITPATDPERWGDYSGLCKVYGEPCGIGFAGSSYGTASNTNATWIGKIHAPNCLPVGEAEPSLEESNIKIYPNPASDNLNIAFNLDIPASGLYKVRIYAIDGKDLGEIVSRQLSSGEALVSFSVQHLNDGFYFAEIKSSNGTAIRKKFIVVH